MIGKNKGIRILANVVLGLLTICVIVPFILLISSSMTAEQALIRDGYGFIPREVDFTAYKMLLGGSASILHGYLVSFGITLFGTLSSLIITTLFAIHFPERICQGVVFWHFFSFLPCFLTAVWYPAT